MVEFTALTTLWFNLWLESAGAFVQCTLGGSIQNTSWTQRSNLGSQIYKDIRVFGLWDEAGENLYRH